MWACSQLEKWNFDMVTPKPPLFRVMYCCILTSPVHPDNCSGKNICNLAKRKFFTIGGCHCFDWFEPRCCPEEFLDTAAGIVVEHKRWIIARSLSENLQQNDQIFKRLHFAVYHKL